MAYKSQHIRCDIMCLMKTLFLSVCLLFFIGCGHKSSRFGPVTDGCVDFFVDAKVSQVIPVNRQGRTNFNLTSFFQEQGWEAPVVDLNGKTVQLEVLLFMSPSSARTNARQLIGRSEVANFEVGVQTSHYDYEDQDELGSFHALTREAVQDGLEKMRASLQPRLADQPWRAAVNNVSTEDEQQQVSITTEASHGLRVDDTFQIYAPLQESTADADDEDKEEDEGEETFCHTLTRSHVLLATAQVSSIDDEKEEALLTITSKEENARSVQIDDIVELTREHTNEQMTVSLYLGYIWRHLENFKVGQRAYTEDLSRLLRHYILTQSADYHFEVVP